MPSIIKTGPKLPSFQTLKKRKRTGQESAEQLPEAPQAKKPRLASSSIPESSQSSTDRPKANHDAKKRLKSLDWKKKMSAGKDQRLKEKKNPKSKNSASSSSGPAKIVPGQNWKQLQVRFHCIIAYSCSYLHYKSQKLTLFSILVCFFFFSRQR
jgi:hypothetical protein